MAANTFGSLFAVTTFGESHGPAVGCVIDGCPPGLPLDRAAIQAQLDRRRPGQSALTTPRQEADAIEVLSGLSEDGRTLGTPLALMVRNRDQRSSCYEDWHHIYRPSHADFTYDAKYGLRAWQGGGRASARETIGRVAAGAVAEQILRQRLPDLRIVAWVARIHDIPAHAVPADLDRTRVDSHPTRCPDPKAAAAMEAAILAAAEQGDSLGGWLELVIDGLPPGLGDPVFAKLDAALAGAFLGLPACKGCEIGAGFAGAVETTGAGHNDPFRWQDGRLITTSNRSGGIQGGISNGMPITARVAFKPTATIMSAQDSADDQGNNVTLAAHGRHDPCVLPRAVPMVEAMAALVLCDAYLRQRGQCGDPWPDPAHAPA